MSDKAPEENPKKAFGDAKPGIGNVPASVLQELGPAMDEGAEKYGRYNWRDTSVQAETYYNSTIRHLMQWWEGEDIDPDSGISHVTKAIAGLFVLRDAMIHEKFIDDRPQKGGE